MELNIASKKKFIRSFGRIKSRKLSDHKKDLFDNLLPQYQIKNSLEEINVSQNNIKLEIGFGFGDSLFNNAKGNPDTTFIGCETHVNGIINLLSKLEKEPLNNVKIYIDDIRFLLEKNTQKIFNQIYILFPDPWPKSKQNKRRLINADFLKLIHRAMLINSKLTIATDDDSYKTHIMSEITRSNLFYWLVKSQQDWKFPSDWLKTKYHQKADEAGRESVFLEFIKN